MKYARHGKTNTKCSCSYVQTKKVDFITVESKRVVTRGERDRDRGKIEVDWIPET
jgi:hypothetical protein